MKGIKSWLLSSVCVLSAMFSSVVMHAQDEIPVPTPGPSPESTPSQSITLREEVMMSQYWAMPTLYNPATTGEIDFIRVRAAARMEYFGSHASPKNYLATADSPFKIGNKRIGAGVVVNSESYDLFRNLLIGAQGSYKFNFKKGRLSVGLQIGYYHSKFKGSELNLADRNDNEGIDTLDDVIDSGDEDTDDNEGGDNPGGGDYEPDLPTTDVAAGAFDLSVGVRYDHPKFHVGISAMHLTNPKMKLTTENESATATRYIESKLLTTLYFDAGGNIGINNSLITLQPSMLLGTDFSNFRGIVEMRATYNNMISFGVNYRYNRAAGVLAALNLKNFYVGYAWEYDYGQNPKGSTGNHELVLGYQFKLNLGGKNLFSHRSIRIM